jgi:hypothetical protein
MLVANALQATLEGGGTAIVMSPDQNHRFGVEMFPSECHKLGLFVKVDDKLRNNTGYYDDGRYNSFTMFTVTKGQGEEEQNMKE